MEKTQIVIELLVEVECPDADDIYDILDDYFSPGQDGPVEILSATYKD